MLPCPETRNTEYLANFFLFFANSNSLSDSMKLRSPIHRAQSFKVETVSNRYDIALIYCTYLHTCIFYTLKYITINNLLLLLLNIIISSIIFTIRLF